MSNKTYAIIYMVFNQASGKIKKPLLITSRGSRYYGLGINNSLIVYGSFNRRRRRNTSRNYFNGNKGYCCRMSMLTYLLNKKDPGNAGVLVFVTPPVKESAKLSQLTN